MAGSEECARRDAQELSNDARCGGVCKAPWGVIACQQTHRFFSSSLITDPLSALQEPSDAGQGSARNVQCNRVSNHVFKMRYVIST